MLNNRRLKITEYVLLTVAVLIPCGLLLSYAAILIGALSLFCIFSGPKPVKISKQSWGYYTPAILFVLYTISLIYSHDTRAAMFELEVMLLLGFFPLLILFVPVTRKMFMHISIAFILGYTLSIITHIFISITRIPQSGFNAIYYTSLAGNQHPTYLSMYNSWCIILCFYFLMFNTPGRYYKTLLYVLILFLFSMVVFLGSKAGILTCMALIVFLFIKMLRQQARMYNIIVLLLGLFMVVGLQAFITTHISNRVSVTARAIPAGHGVDTVHNSIESTNARKASFQASFYLFKRSPLLGYGCGDVQNKLDEVYESRGLTKIKEEHLNAHNQYLQTGMAVGILGSVLLAVWLFGLFSQHVPGTFRYLASALAIILIINFMFESMLERQMGIMFIMFWHCLVLKTKIE